MQEAIRSYRARVGEEVELRRVGLLAGIREERRAEVLRARRLAAHNRRDVDAWAATAQRQIKTERQRRKVEIEAELRRTLREQNQQVERRVKDVESALAAHRAELDAFFEEIEQERDPVTIVQRARRSAAVPRNRRNRVRGDHPGRDRAGGNRLAAAGPGTRNRVTDYRVGRRQNRRCPRWQLASRSGLDTRGDRGAARFVRYRSCASPSRASSCTSSARATTVSTTVGGGMMPSSTISWTCRCASAVRFVAVISASSASGAGPLAIAEA